MMISLPFKLLPVRENASSRGRDRLMRLFQPVLKEIRDDAAASETWLFVVRSRLDTVHARDMTQPTTEGGRE